MFPELPPEPGEVVHPRPAAGHDHERLLAGAGDGQVTPDPAGGAEHRRVHHGPGAPVDPVRADPFEEREGVWPLDVELDVGGQVEERRALARREVLGADGRRPVLGRPAGPRLPRGAAQDFVRVEPLRTLPARAREELGAELHVPLVERRQPEPAWACRLLQRVQDVVDLAVLLLPAFQHVERGRLEGVEAVGVGLGQVVAGLAGRHPLGDLPAHPPGMRDPDGFADPHAADTRALAHDRAGVGREREHPVEGADRVGRAHRPGERREKPRGLGLGIVEVARRERHQRRLELAARRGKLGLQRRDRLVVVAPYAVVILALAEVHREVLVAQDRVDDLARLARELLERVGPHELVLDREQRDRDPGHRPDRRPPDACADQHALALDPPLVGEHGADATAGDVEPRDRDFALERDAAGRSASGERGRDPHALRDPVGADEVRAEDRRGIEQWDPLGGLLRREQLGVLDPVGPRPPAPATQLRHPRLARGDLDPADPVPARLTVHVERRVEPDRVLRDPAHRA
jgi:hypothetical protein